MPLNQSKNYDFELNSEHLFLSVQRDAEVLSMMIGIFKYTLGRQSEEI